MAKTGKSSKKKAMPYLAAAVICEKALQESDRVFSAIRIVDTITVSKEPDSGSTVALPLTLLISFKSANARGNRKLHVHVSTPSGKKDRIGQAVMKFASPPEGGFTAQIPLIIKWEAAGLYWIDVSLDDTTYTKIPLRVHVGMGVVSTAPKK